MTKRIWITAVGATALAVWVGCGKAPETAVSQTPAPVVEQVAVDAAPEADVIPADAAGETLLVTLDVPNMV